MSADAKVSIIILNLSRSALTRECVTDVIENTEPGSFEIIVVDNGSSADELEQLVLPASVDLVRLNRNMFFGEANNIGAERANGAYLMFLNNDVKVTSGWLAAMLNVFDGGTNVGAVGPKFLFADGSLQEAGAYFLPDGGTTQVRYPATAMPPRYVDGIHIVDYCSAACLLLRKRDFTALGGFDPVFEPAYFEDADLAVRLRSIGLFSYCCGQAVVYHEQNVTSRRIWSLEQLSGYFEANSRKFSRRWGGYVRRRMDEPCEPQPLPPLAWQPEAPPTGRDRIILYSSNPIDVSETSRSLLLTACAFQDTHDVIIAADEVVSRCRVYSLCREFGVELASFRTRNISDVAAVESDFMVTFDIRGSTPGCFAKHLKFERDGDKLLEVLDRVWGS